MPMISPSLNRQFHGPSHSSRAPLTQQTWTYHQSRGLAERGQEEEEENEQH